MGDTFSVRERRRREALEWWNAEVQLSSFARHLSSDARVVASNPVLRFNSEAEAEADRWRRATKIFGEEVVYTLRVDLLLAGPSLFDPAEGDAPLRSVEPRRIVPAAHHTIGATAQSPLPRPPSRPPTMQPAASPSGQATMNSAIDWHRVNRDNMTPLVDHTATPPGPPPGPVGWYRTRAQRGGLSARATWIAMLAVVVACAVLVLLAVF